MQQLRYGPTYTSSRVEQQGIVDRRLRGRWLAIARAAWLTILVLALGFFFIGIPFRLQQLFRLALEAGRSFLEVVLSIHFYPLYVLAIEILLVSGLTLSGLLIVWWRPDDWMVMYLSIAFTTYATYITRPLDALVATFPLLHLPISLLQAIGLGCALLFFYLFPDGRLVPSWTRPLAIIWIGWTVGWFLFPAVPFNLSNPYTLPFIWFLALMGWWFTGVLAQLYRYRRVSSLLLRQQTRWVVFSVTTAVLSYGAYFLPRILLPLSGQPAVMNALYNMMGVPLFLSSLLIIPLFIAFSILRYHLFDIDVIINRALVYGMLTGILAVIYFGSVIALQFLVHGLTGQARQSPLAVVASTLLIAALFQPLRYRIQAIIDRRFYRRKYDAAKTLEAFSATLRSGDIERAPGDGGRRGDAASICLAVAAQARTGGKTRKITKPLTSLLSMAILLVVNAPYQALITKTLKKHMLSKQAQQQFSFYYWFSPPA